MTFLRASIPDDQYRHVLSFQRQIYVLPDVPEEELNEFNITVSLLINFEGEEFR